jgi:hypothetical protein
MPEKFEDDEDEWVSLGEAVSEAILNGARAYACHMLREAVENGEIPIKRMDGGADE